MGLKSFVREGVEYKVGDSVLLNPADQDDDIAPFVARIDSIQPTKKKNEYMMNITWFYRPEDVGRRVR